MATLALSLVGQAAGAALGSTAFATLGRAAGAIAGYAIDQALFGNRGGGTNRTYEGPRLADLDIQASSEGAAIPRVYGRARLAGQIIWATRFEEVVVTTTETTSTSSGGGKGFGGGSSSASATRTTRTYRYFANLAVGICEGPITRIGRIWADGELLDTSAIAVRTYLGGEDQEPDSLIEAKEAGAVPAYRGLAYVVFERLPLEGFGNRLPQLTFEIVNVLPGLESRLTAVTLIPGATEFGYEPARVVRTPSAGVTDTENAHVAGVTSDWTASLDELQALCPNLERVALVVAWFGTDLRAGECRLRPAVDNREKVTSGATWAVAGLTRGSAALVSGHDGRPAFGGTPSDAAVIHAIRDLKARGLEVMLHPFVMMDVPAGNVLPDPWTGAAGQPAYPWRGRITCDPAPGEAGSPDGTAAVSAEIAAFVGAAAPGQFGASGESVVYSGPAEWTLRRMLLHYARLAAIAGGVDAFLLGSELRGLTSLRSGPGAYPFVAALAALATDVRAILGPQAAISYAADWSEYFGHQPADGTGDVYFNLDPLWAAPDIDFVGINNYMPLADWRPEDDHLDAALAESPADIGYLRANIAGGEYFDWYYASQGDRAAQVRTPVTDGLGKPWVFRPKDIVAWWSSLHYDRPGGIEMAIPTAWQPGLKPIRFTEIGCPAVDLGANQPNMFPDPKSVESGLPHFSNGRRDDDAQRAFLEAMLGWWDPADPLFEAAANPLSPVYGGRMVDPAGLFVWTWDARPFPAFPHMLDVWADGGNWSTGHWLNGRLGGISLAALVATILDRAGFADYDVTGLRGVVDGYVVDRPMSARDALDPLLTVGLLEAVDTGTALVFRNRPARPRRVLGLADLVEEKETALLALKRAEETDLPAEVTVGFTGNLVDYRRAVAASRRLVGGSRRTVSADLAAILNPDLGARLAEDWLHDLWAGRETVDFALPPSAVALEPGDIVGLEREGTQRLFEVTSIAEAGRLRVSARSIDPRKPAGDGATTRLQRLERAIVHGKPWPLVLDLPLLPSDETSTGARIAVLAEPWPGSVAVYRAPGSEGYGLVLAVDRPATIGRLAEPLPPGPLGVWDRGNRIDVVLGAGALSSQPQSLVLAGANAAAIGSVETGWEIVQFADAELVDTMTWRLSGLLRGQAGSEDIMAAGHPADAVFVLLDGAVEPLDIGLDRIGLPLSYRIGPAAYEIGHETYDDFVATLSGRGLMPLSPVHVRARRDAASGDIAIAWTRRTRIGGDGWAAVDVPLGEAGEAYRVEILDGASVRRTIETTAPLAVYAAADELADFGAVQASLDLRVAQLGATVGAGIARTVTLPL